MFKLIKGFVIVAILVGLSLPATSAPDIRKLSDGSVLTDPTKPKGWRTVAPARSSVTYKLNYILSSESASGRKQAIVNGKKVTEGDSVAGARVVRISEGEVVLSVNGAKRVLKINKPKRVVKK